MITTNLFNRLFPTAGLDTRKYNLVRDRDELIDALNLILPRYEITSYLRVCAFLAACGIETDYFRTTVEYASGDAYEGRGDLGNTQPGDGRLFKGRGLLQTSGRYNYEQLQKAIGEILGIDVVAQPDILSRIDIAVESACVFWRDHDLNAYADRGEFKQLSGIVNRGDKNKAPLAWAKRNELYSKCKRVIPKDFLLLPNKQVQPAGVLATNQPATGDSDYLAELFDKNVSADQVRGLAKQHSPRVLMQIARGAMWVYAALEAGNIYAWLGVSVAVSLIILELYLRRATIARLALKLKAKLTQ